MSPTSMMSLERMYIPPPDQVVYRPYSSVYVRGDYSRIGDGFATAEWIWDIISISRLSNLLALLSGNDYIRLYVITDKRDGTYPNPRSSFSLFNATMWKPILTGEEGVAVARSPYAMQTVKIQFINLVELTGYL
jgi:hypothetical protein